MLHGKDISKGDKMNRSPIEAGGWPGLRRLTLRRLVNALYILQLAFSMKRFLANVCRVKSMIAFVVDVRHCRSSALHL